MNQQDWIGDLPHSWTLQRLGALGDLYKGNGGSKEDNRDSGVPVVRYGELYTKFDRVIRGAQSFIGKEASSRYTPLPKGCIVFAGSGEDPEEIGKAALSLLTEPAFVGGDSVVFAPRLSKIDPEYLTYVLDSKPLRAHKAVRSTGFTVVHISAGKLKTLPIPLPPLDEQRAIAEYLDQETAQIDALVAKQEEFIRLLRQKRIAQITNSVCRGLDESAHLVPSEADWFDSVPSHWNVRRLKDSIQDAQAGAWGADPVGDGTDVRCVRVADFDRPSLMVGHVPTLRSVNAKDYHPRALRPGDLLLEKSGGTALNPVGFVAMYAGDYERAVSSNFITRLRLKHGQDSRFWLYAHAASYGTRLTARSVKQTTGIQNLDQASYFNELFPFPPLQEQQAIASYLDNWTSRIDTLISKAEEHVTLAKERRAALITAAVTGQIDVRTVRKAS